MRQPQTDKRFICGCLFYLCHIILNLLCEMSCWPMDCLWLPFCKCLAKCTISRETMWTRWIPGNLALTFSAHVTSMKRFPAHGITFLCGIAIYSYKSSAALCKLAGNRIGRIDSIDCMRKGQIICTTFHEQIQFDKYKYVAVIHSKTT